jgi:hypothetical protein
MDWDVSKFDMSLKFLILGLLQMSNILLFNPTHRFYHLYRIYLAHEADMDVIKFVQWMDGLWRLVIGQNFSGKFTTSHMNTEYSIFFLILFLLDMAEKYPEHAKLLLELIIEVLAWVFDADAPFPRVGWLCYGDDGLFWNSIPELAPILNLGNFKKFMKDVMGMEIKASSAGEYDTLISQRDSCGRLKTKKWTFEGATYDIPHGPIFLKRRFILMEINGVVRCVPFRSIDDYYARVGRSISELLDNPLIELCRIHGLMFDTMGTNPHAYCYLNCVRRAIIDLLNTRKIDPDAFPETLSLSSSGAQANREYKYLYDKLAKNGFGTYVPDLRQCPTWDTLRDILDHDYYPVWGDKKFVVPDHWYNLNHGKEFPSGFFDV